MAEVMGAQPVRKQIAQSTQIPTGCQVVPHANGTFDAVFNTQPSEAKCGSGATKFAGKISTNVTGITMNIYLDSSAPGGLVDITLAGPSNVWFGVGFNASAMGDYP